MRVHILRAPDRGSWTGRAFSRISSTPISLSGLDRHGHLRGCNIRLLKVCACRECPETSRGRTVLWSAKDLLEVRLKLYMWRGKPNGAMLVRRPAADLNTDR